MRRDEQFDVGEHAHLDVDVPSGVLQVIAGSGAGTIRVAVDASNVDGFEITRMGDTVAIAESARWLSRSRNVRIAVEVPAGTDVTARSASGEMSLRGRFGAVRLRTASGDIDVDEVDRLEVSTASGDARIGVVHGDAGFKTASGDVAVQSATGRLGASSASGDLTVRTVGGAVDVGTASGDVEIGRCDGNDISVKTVSGNIRLGLPAGIRVEPEIGTISGKVSLPAAAAAVRAGIERRIVRVRLRSTSGDIRISRID
jgi:DUF4097 and DUF4098 domain-containing protein YvlB